MGHSRGSRTAPPTLASAAHFDTASDADSSSVDDAARLPTLNEASVLALLSVHYAINQIYTYSGPFLVALNPFKPIDKLYGRDVAADYRGQVGAAQAPHLYAVAEAAWQGACQEHKSQSLLITGQSGAGKTESTRRVIEYLVGAAAMGEQQQQQAQPRQLQQQGQVGGTEGGHGDGSGSAEVAQAGNEGPGTGLAGRILWANTILESLGNARTQHNDNSSRFGKFIRVWTSLTDDASTPSLAGADIQVYLLETTRVHTHAHAQGERSFHVFYQLLRGGSPALLHELLLAGTNAGHWAFLRGSTKGPLPNEDNDEEALDDVHAKADAQGWSALQCAFRTLGVAEAKQLDWLRILAAILHVGNLQLEAGSDGQARLAGGGRETVKVIARLLGLNGDDLRETLLNPRIQAGKETIRQSRTPAQVRNDVAAVCKKLYHRVFSDVVAHINHALAGSTPAAAAAAKGSFIGVLDIAGFEIFGTNSLEQLLINLTHEKLQQFFNHRMFVVEQDEYKREEIGWDVSESYGQDLQPAIVRIEGVLRCLDDETRMPRGSDERFEAKCGSDQNPVDGKANVFKPNRFGGGFAIRHYAGEVAYSTTGWVHKNRDPQSAALLGLLSASSDAFVAGLLAKDAEDAKCTGSSFRSVAQVHRSGLSCLVQQLEATHPHFVRCILPNAKRSPGNLEAPLVLDQMRCNGIVEGVRLAQRGFPSRVDFSAFVAQHKVLLAEPALEAREACRSILEAVHFDKELYRIGRTRLLLKSGALTLLRNLEQRRREELMAGFQAACRALIVQRAFPKRLARLKAATITLQRYARMQARLNAWPWWRLYSLLRPRLSVEAREERQREKIRSVTARHEAEVTQLHAAAQEALGRASRREAELQAEAQALRDDKDQRDAAAAAAVAEKAEYEARLASANEGLAQSKRREEALRDKCARLRSDLKEKASASVEERSEGEKQLAAAHQAGADAAQRLAQSQERASGLARRCETLQSTLEHERAAAGAAAGAAEAASTNLRAELNEAREELTRIGAMEKEWKEKVEALEARVAEVQARLLDEERAGQEATSRVSELSMELQGARSDLETAKGEFADAEAESVDTKTALEHQLEERTAEIASLRDELELCVAVRAQCEDEAKASVVEKERYAQALSQAESREAAVRKEMAEKEKMMAEKEKMVSEKEKMTAEEEKMMAEKEKTMAKKEKVMAEKEKMMAPLIEEILSIKAEAAARLGDQGQGGE